MLESGQGVFDRDDELVAAGHEQVVFCRDEETGLQAIISIHSTSRGPALGDVTSLWPFDIKEGASLVAGTMR